MNTRYQVRLLLKAAKIATMEAMSSADSLAQVKIEGCPDDALSMTATEPGFSDQLRFDAEVKLRHRNATRAVRLIKLLTP